MACLRGYGALVTKIVVRYHDISSKIQQIQRSDNYNTVNFSKIFTIDHLAYKGEIWGVYCEFITWATVRSRYNAVNFLPNTYKNYVEPLWVQPQIKVCPSRCRAVYNIHFYWTALYRHSTIYSNSYSYHAVCGIMLYWNVLWREQDRYQRFSTRASLFSARDFKIKWRPLRLAGIWTFFPRAERYRCVAMS